MTFLLKTPPELPTPASCVPATQSTTPSTFPSPEPSADQDKDAIIADLKKQLKNKNIIINRLRQRVKSLKELISDLRKKNLIDRRCEDLLNKKFAGPSIEIFKRLMKGKKLGRYSENMKSFALTLHFYSKLTILSEKYSTLRCPIPKVLQLGTAKSQQTLDLRSQPLKL